ncbi:P-loop containing nucleoside triphosphate hydrolase protein [Auriscalpium vulgare]|uniref:P-loop containing nucleoside triphosphate hydrolase protein n=1 Tax=Auriscalpium vulgare TaxID=40419 RepID=A0ACB8RUN2_9AGAM|nr:P-loop containing nucleoside triphosphate hydrolase protein [Auriscalpium vulgare]
MPKRRNPPKNPPVKKPTATRETRAAAHEAQRLVSRALLEKTRTAAAKNGYDSIEARKRMVDECKRRSNGKIIPYTWQLDVAEALVLGIDSELIAPTGAGKTIPFALPLFHDDKKIIIIISPLNALEEDQARRFQELGLSSTAVNGNTYSDALHKEIKAGKHHVIITSPNMCLQHQQFRALLSSPRFAKRIGAFIVDEAHCITQWGDKFRTEYAQLGTLRAFVSAHVPFLVTSATLTRDDLQQVRKSLLIDKATTFHLNRGNDRPNLEWNVRYMKAGKSDLDSLEFLLPTDPNSESATLPRALVFFDNILTSMEARRWFQERLPPRLQDRVACYSARRGPDSKSDALEKFVSGEHDILFTTEAAGMGCDISDIEIVVQFMVPGSLSIWLQRAGRAGRKRGSLARAYLLVQPTVLQEKGKKTRLPGEDITYVKAVEDGLREWIESNECRRDVADDYFFNPPDREATWYARYSDCSWGAEGVLSDKMLTAFATNLRWKTLDDLRETPVAKWAWLERHGEEVLKCLRELDEKTEADKEQAKKARMDAQKAETAARNAEKKAAADQARKEQQVARAAERERKKAERAQQPPKPRLSRARARVPIADDPMSANIVNVSCLLQIYSAS